MNTKTIRNDAADLLQMVALVSLAFAVLVAVWHGGPWHLVGKLITTGFAGLVLAAVIQGE